MKKFISKYIVIILLSGNMIACDDYERTGVEKGIYVNQTSLSLFVGDKIQLTASPTEGIFDWSSEDTEVATVTNNGLVEVVGKGTTYIIVRSGEAEEKVLLIAIVRIPLQDVLISESYVEMLPGDKRNILVTLVPEDVNEQFDAQWHSENSDIATVSSNGEITAIGEGVTNITYSVGNIVKTIVVDAAYTRPFKGPHLLTAAEPLVIKAADFDLGGEGYAFHENDVPDNSGLNGYYRQNNNDNKSNSVDIEGEDGFNVGWAEGGEWLVYTIEVADAGIYAFETLVAIKGNGAGFHLEVDNVNVTGSIAVPNTYSWGNFVWIPDPGNALTLNLTEGRHKIKYYLEGEHNISEIKFTKK